MDKEKQARLAAAGWQVGATSDFLELTPEEIQYIELKLMLSKAVREQRNQQQLTQVAFAERIGTSQSRVAKMENGDPSVSLDLLFKSLFALGVTREEVFDLG